MNILIVQGDHRFSMSLKLMLNECVTDVMDNVLQAFDCHSALSLCKKQRFDYIFSDIELPGGDIVYLLSQLADNHRLPHVVIVSDCASNIVKLTQTTADALHFPSVSRLKKSLVSGDIKQIFAARVNHCGAINHRVISEHYFTETEIFAAIENGEIFNYYQSQVDFKSNAIIGVEAFARWEHPFLGVLDAEQFLPLIHAKETYNVLFKAVLIKSIRAIKGIEPQIKLSVNLNQKDLQWVDIYQEVKKICCDEGFNYQNLTLELVETDIYEVDINAFVNIARLKLLGISLAIKDFGVGSSSLQKITQIPFDILKISKVFSHDIKHNYQHAAIVKLAINAAKALGMISIVEGVEDEESWNYIRNMGAVACQGYYTGRPMPINQLKETISASSIISDSNLIDCLIIDDQPIVGASLKFNLSQDPRFSTVNYVLESRMALDYVRDNACNLVIADINLNNEDGFDLVTLLRSKGFCGNVIMMSGIKNPIYQQLASGIGAAGFIDKSMDLNALVERVFYLSGQAAIGVDHEKKKILCIR
ncbi:EAL domain-containing protein [Psychromonas sp. MME1]|uniref:EAL domain-containing protein n=1 Tax=Psychromonas sp. MME1 TaxID=3231032 RepID=UPI0034E22690